MSGISPNLSGTGHSVPITAANPANRPVPVRHRRVVSV
jgi:hypothetical protein